MRNHPPRDAPPIQRFAGDRSELLHLFRLADDSEAAIASYMNEGIMLTALDEHEVVGHLQLILGEPCEIKSLAVIPSHRGRSVGRALVETACQHARSCGAQMIEVSTATADVQVLRFYQRLGFRMARIERDVFTEAAGYPADAMIDGVPLLDRVWLDRPI